MNKRIPPPPRQYPLQAMPTLKSLAVALFVLLSPLSLIAGKANGEQLFKIRVLEKQSGWPVPLVELTTTHEVRFVSDNDGVIAFDLPELMNRPTWFTIKGHGYGVPPDGFGFEGVLLRPTPGGEAEVRVQRNLPAKRLGRITGGGIFGESQRFGHHLDWKEQGILGCDSVQNVLHQGKLFWCWGDTTLAHYPLGLFHMIGATTETRPLQSFTPPIKMAYHYFADQQGNPREIAKLPGDGPTWLNGLVSLKDESGSEQLGATYTKILPPLTPVELGLCLWDANSERFQPLKTLWQADPSINGSLQKNELAFTAYPHGHPVMATDEEGIAWIYFGDPFPTLRCRARFESWSDPSQWQPLSPPQFALAQDGTTRITPHRGAIAWNSYRNRWISIFTQLAGSDESGRPSYLGELWYAEAEEITGPWTNGVKVVTHNEYTFYNPQLHPQLTADNPRVLLFEATFTKTFSKTATGVPRHEYNQVLYRIDLDDPQMGTSD